jgi:uncharacterized membrane protein
VARVVVGAFSGAALCAAAQQSPLAGALLGAIGGVAGTLGGYEAHGTGARSEGAGPGDRALEDALAIGGGLFLISRLG